MSDVQEYPEVFQEVRGALNPGRLKLQSNSVTFKNIKTGKVDQYQSTDIEFVHWLKRARGNCLKIILTNGNIHRYDGFKEMDFDKLSGFVSKYYNSELEKVDLALKGWNWGITEFVGNALEFKINNNLAFEVPLANVSHSTTSKNEVTLEFHQNDDAAVSLTELRFHIPTDNNNPDAEFDSVTKFYNNVLAKADIIQATGDAVVTFTEVQCLTPRGRYDIKLYPTFLQLHGKTFDYKVPYTTVLRLFLLPHKDSRQMFFVVSVDPPIKQGQTRYHFLILLFNKDDEMTVELGMTEEELQEKYDGKLTPEMHGLEYEVVSKIFKAITNRKITVPGSFEGKHGTRCVGCSYKAATGLLYPLERGFIFVHKPPLHIRFDEIACVNFGRSTSNTKSFDFEIETQTNVYHFVGIEKDEYGKLFDFVSSKKLRVKNINNKKSSANAGDLSGSDEEGGDHDAYLERMKAEGKQRDEDFDDDDETDSSDESYNPGGSGSEVAEEYDSNPPTTDSDDSDEDDSESGKEDTEEKRARREQREKEKAEKREKKEKEKKKKPRTAKTVPEGGRKRKEKRKSKREKGQPKRPMSSYFLWLNENREKIKEENPGISITDISKKAGEMWKKVDDKTKWEKLNEKAKEDYAKAMEEWKNREKSGSDEEKEDDTKSKKKKSKKSSSSPSKKVTETKMGAGGDYKSKEFISSSDSGNEKPVKKKLRKDGSESEKELPSEPDEATPNTSEDSGHSGKEGKKSDAESGSAASGGSGGSGSGSGSD